MCAERSLEIVAEYLESHPDIAESFELTPKKIQERSEIIEDPQCPNSIVFEVERHMGVLGASYRKGHGMSAFVTYWPRFAFQPDTHSIREIGEFRNRTIDVDFSALAAEFLFECFQLEFEPTDAAAFLCRETTSGEERLVNSQVETEVFAAEVVRAWDLSYYADQLSDYLDPTKIDEFITELKEVLESEVRLLAEHAWNDLKDPI